MLTVATVLLTGLAIYYAAAMGYFAIGFRRVVHAVPQDAPLPEILPFVSVIVPARDEEDTIRPCLRALMNSEYPSDRYEVIVVDDFSRDATVECVRSVQRATDRPAMVPGGETNAADSHERLRLLCMSDEFDEAAGHKHAALRRGIDIAHGEFILTTDADCMPRPGWIPAMVRALTPGTAFVAGPVLYQASRSWIDRIQALEFLGLIAVGAGAIGVDRPILCNSANVAYRRSVYEDLAGRDVERPSPVEDEIMLQRIAAETPWCVRFCADRQAVVTTSPVETWRTFVHQRMRWAGSGASYPNPWLVLALTLIWAFYALLFGSLLALPGATGLAPAVAAALTLKVASEAVLLWPACRHFGRKRLFRYFLPGQLLQIPYVVFIALAGLFGTADWKGRPVT